MPTLQTRADTMRHQAIRLSHQAINLITQLHNAFDPDAFTNTSILLSEIEDLVRDLRNNHIYFTPDED